VNNRKTLLLTFLFSVAVILALITGCNKTPDSPPIKTKPTFGFITISQLRKMYADSASAGKTSVFFNQDISLRCVVTMDESSGNIYKAVYVRDYSGTQSTVTASLPYGAIMLKLIKSGGLHQGDSIRLNLNGSRLDLGPISSAGQFGTSFLEIDSVNVTTQVVKLQTGLNPAPIYLALPANGTLIAAFNNTYTLNNQYTYVYDAQLVYLNSVEFMPLAYIASHGLVDTGSTVFMGYPFQGGTTPGTTFNLRDCASANDTIPVYTSEYANFAGATVPGKSGSAFAIISVYKGMQLTLRSYNLTNPYIK